MPGFSSWKAAYLEVLQESDKTKLSELVYAVEAARFRDHRFHPAC